MTELVMGLGILLGLLFHEVAGLSPGGVVAPAYLAVFLDQPARVAGTLLVSAATYAAMRGLGAGLMLYGRRKMGVTLAVGFLLRLGWDAIITTSGAGAAAAGFTAIGFIVPGLIASDMERQGVLRTWAALLIVAALVRLAIYAARGLGWL